MMRFILQAGCFTRGCLVVAILVFSLAGCVIPVPETAIPSATTRPSISDPMLTAAAKTIVADLQSLNTLAAATEQPDRRASSGKQSPTAMPSPVAQQTAEAPLAPIPTIAATEFPTSTVPQPPTATATQAATVTPQPPPTDTSTPPPPAVPPPLITPGLIPTAALHVVTPTAAAIGETPPGIPASAPIVVAPIPPSLFNAPIREYGEQFVIKEILIPACADGAWTVFRILNNSQDKLESLSLHMQDLSTGEVLAGPWVSNTPFFNNAMNCAVGNLDLLNAGREMYLGQMPGENGLTGHRLRVAIKLCAKEDLKDACTQKAVEFIFP